MWEKIKNNLLAIISIACVIFVLLFLSQCNSTKNLKKEAERQAQISKQNYAALNDSIKVYKDKSGKTAYSKPIVDMSADDVKKYFPDLYERLKSELGVKIIWKYKIEYRDTGSVKNAIVKIDSNKFSLNYDYTSKDSLLHIKSTNTFFADAVLVDKDANKYSVDARPGVSTINDISLKLNFTTGIKKEDNLYKIFITPDNKNVTVGQIEGADVSNMLNPPIPSSKKKRWSVGPYIGAGITFGFNGKYQAGIGVGVSLQYSLIKF